MLLHRVHGYSRPVVAARGPVRPPGEPSLAKGWIQNLFDVRRTEYEFIIVIHARYLGRQYAADRAAR